jgi:hypothetical protein
MHKSVALFAVGGIAAAATAAFLGVWLPARHDRQNAAWTAAGERALAHVALPPRYSTTTGDRRIQVCSNGPTERCFLGLGDPTAQVATVTAALTAVATGPVHAVCSTAPAPFSPASCHLTVPVAGSRLAAELFARPRDRSKPFAQWTYAGGYVLIHLDQN